LRASIPAHSALNGPSRSDILPPHNDPHVAGLVRDRRVLRHQPADRPVVSQAGVRLDGGIPSSPGAKPPGGLAGTSMVATTFRGGHAAGSDGLGGQLRHRGNWLWWNLLLATCSLVFFFARLWRRAGVVTDLEFTELRYGGKPAAFLRGFRALYLGLPINCIILGWVNLAMVKIVLMIFPDLTFPRWASCNEAGSRYASCLGLCC